MILSIGSDHGGFAYKEAIKEHLVSQGHEVIDCGCFGTESVDYPEFGIKAAELVRDGKADRGIVICTTGIGMSIATSKALDAIARQPEADGKIRTTLLLGLAFIETTAIYGLFIAIMLMTKVL